MGSVAVHHPVGVRRGPQQIEIAFVAPVLETPTAEIRGMVRGDDSIESQRAAVNVKGHTTIIQAAILHAIATERPMNAREMETRKEFSGYGPSTVRKRMSELRLAGRLVVVDRRDGMAVLGIPATERK